MNLRQLILSLMTIPFALQSFAPNELKTAQMKFERVREAFDQKGDVVHKILTDKGVKSGSLHLILVAYKEEKQLELWGANNAGSKHVLLKTYSVCAASGTFGPKRKEGDSQVPEGLYHIDRFNPMSTYHLSLGINYPNASDKVLSDKTRPGGDIFIHGECASIGCLAMTNDKIKEIYPLAILAKDAGQTKIPVYIFPCKMDGNSMSDLKSEAEGNEKLGQFWNNLKVCYDRFQATKQPVAFSVNAQGRYVLK